MRVHRPSYLRLTPAAPGSVRLRDVRVRWWHPWVIVLALRGVLRELGFLRPICAICGGAGRLVKARFFRRRRCVICDGTGRVQRPPFASRCDVGSDIPGGGAA